MKNRCTGLLVLLAIAPTGSWANDAQKWWEHIRFLATDEMRGRETGSPEHRRAAEYVAMYGPSCQHPSPSWSLSYSSQP